MNEENLRELFDTLYSLMIEVNRDRADDDTIEGLAQCAEAIFGLASEQDSMPSIRTFSDVGMLSENNGVVIRFDGEEFQLPIIHGARS